MSEFIFGESRLTIEDINDIAFQRKTARLSPSPKFAKKIQDGADFLDKSITELGGIYGVTTGLGDSCMKKVPPEKYNELPLRLTRYHGCGMGDYFDEPTTRAIIAVRLNTLAFGCSGVSMNLLRGMEALLVNDILPLIPEEGSVGASGDLTPLSYVAGAIVGERNVRYKGTIRNSGEVFRELGIPLVTLRPKEGLAIMNGTGVMNAIACLAYSRAMYVADLACRITAMDSTALKGNAYHFSERLFEMKPHPGLVEAAKKIRDDLGGVSSLDVFPDRIQDVYSIRCAPHVIGVLYESAPLFRTIIETEMNSANDNPLIDPSTRSVYHGGHFYGGHIAFVMDSMKNLVANVADLLDRQLELIVDEKFNRGLPPNLSGSDEGYSFNHGFKAVQIAVSAWTAEALKGTMPASVFSRSTECHNQDKVSMGTISARDCVRVLELTEQVAAACLLAATQALRIRIKKSEIAESKIAAFRKMYDQVCDSFEFLAADRQLESDLRATVDAILGQRWKIYG
ncbi:MAG TPA: aromatic amino acid ammonia-lyase [Treponemataceae bacterium]|nr:aromatic amino acid ammonia-lyase [Treponemataceae bacterium]